MKGEGKRQKAKGKRQKGGGALRALPFLFFSSPDGVGFITFAFCLLPFAFCLRLAFFL
jgi:hypothetical protein